MVGRAGAVYYLLQPMHSSQVFLGRPTWGQNKVCGQRFNLNGNLAQHRRDVHTREGPSFTCVSAVREGIQQMLWWRCSARTVPSWRVSLGRKTWTTGKSCLPLRTPDSVTYGGGGHNNSQEMRIVRGKKAINTGEKGTTSQITKTAW